MSSAGGTWSDTISDFFSNLVSDLGDAISFVVDLGKAVVDWIIDGIRSVGSRIWQAIVDVILSHLPGLGQSAQQGGVQNQGAVMAPATMIPSMISPNNLMGSNTSVSVSIGPVTIMDAMDMAVFEARVRQAVADAI